ncbi:MAG: hypothetical protein R3F62_24490 [Planctomycetota bacterium]
MTAEAGAPPQAGLNEGDDLEQRGFGVVQGGYPVGELTEGAVLRVAGGGEGGGDLAPAVGELALAGGVEELGGEAAVLSGVARRERGR